MIELDQGGSPLNILTAFCAACAPFFPISPIFLPGERGQIKMKVGYKLKSAMVKMKMYQ